MQVRTSFLTQKINKLAQTGYSLDRTEATVRHCGSRLKPCLSEGFASPFKGLNTMQENVSRTL